MDSIIPYIALDLITVIVVGIWMIPKICFWHPLTIYLVFHIFSFSKRAYEIYAGAPLMYEGQLYADIIRPEEIYRAILIGDLCLIIFTLGSWLAHKKSNSVARQPVPIRAINSTITTTVATIALPLGAVALFYAKSYGLQANVDDASTGYIQAIAMWPIGVAGLLVYTFGFRWYSVLIAAIYLSTVAFQGYHRFMLILPLFYFTAVYLQFHRLRWPNFWILPCAIFIAAVFPDLKPIGAAIQRGEYSYAASLIGGSISTGEKKIDAKGSDELLDQFAGALTMIDENDRKLMGQTYLSVITLPVPRAWWPSKPGLADHLAEISTPLRRYDKQGRIITYIAESYLNFGYVGLIAVPLIVGYVLTLFFMHSAPGAILGLWHYLYLATFASFLQAFRDGMTSLVLFSIVHNMPMCFVAVANLIPGWSTKVLPRLNAGGETDPRVNPAGRNRL
jgi:hypothetical protein